MNNAPSFRVLFSLFLLLVSPVFAMAYSQTEDGSSNAGSEPSVSAAKKSTPQRHFKFKQKINPVWWFGNADEPTAPAWYRPGKHNRDFSWHCRNPFHNFDAYVIGISDKQFTRTGRFPHDVFNPNGGWNWAVCHYGVLRLPFVAYERKHVSFYWGWRDRGNFGVKLNFASKKPSKAPQEAKTKDTPQSSVSKVDQTAL